MMRATVVFAVPGFPTNAMCSAIDRSLLPLASSAFFILAKAAIFLTCAFTSESPTSSSSFAMAFTGTGLAVTAVFAVFAVSAVFAISASFRLTSSLTFSLP